MNLTEVLNDLVTLRRDSDSTAGDRARLDGVIAKYEKLVAEDPLPTAETSGVPVASVAETTAEAREEAPTEQTQPQPRVSLRPHGV